MPFTLPQDFEVPVKRLRDFLGDHEALNELKGEKESTDEDLYYALLDALDDINYEFVPGVTYKTIHDVPSFNLLKMGATLQILVSKGILSARNLLSYSDSGGITVRDFDTYGRYVNWYNVLINKYMRGVQAMKRSQNIDDCYGGVGSEYGFTN